MTPSFPTKLHLDVAEIISNYFTGIPAIDTVLVVNSCARGQAVPESDLDFAILAGPGVTTEVMENLYSDWLEYSATNTAVLQYKRSGSFAHIHLDIIDGNYKPMIVEPGEPIDFFEIEIGNQLFYSAPMGKAGPHFRSLQDQWLPYYEEDLRLTRMTSVKNACLYDLDHIPFFVKRGLYFQAFEILYKAFQEYLQLLFIANKTYPIAYNKWIKEQVVKWLNKPDLYPQLPPILSISNIESEELNEKAEMLRKKLLIINV